MRSLIVSALFLAVSSHAFGQSMQMDMGDGGNAADKALMDSMMAMNKDMDIKPTGKPDQDFVAMMISHHQGAIDMAKVELKYGHDPKIRKLAKGIVTAQEKEITEMKAWLAKNK
jgi:uncharacterized protein (DUF305 family)